MQIQRDPEDHKGDKGETQRREAGGGSGGEGREPVSGDPGTPPLQGSGNFSW